MQQLLHVIRFGDELAQHGERMAGIGLHSPRWSDAFDIVAWGRLVDAVTAREALARAGEPLASMEGSLGSAGRSAGAAPCIGDLQLAVRDRDRSRYTGARARLDRLHRVRDLLARRDTLADRLSPAPELHDAIRSCPDDPAWDDRLRRFQAAWAWASTGSWILAQDTTDVNALQAQITEYAPPFPMSKDEALRLISRP